MHITRMLNLRQIQLLTFVDQVELQVLVTCTIIPPASSWVLVGYIISMEQVRVE